MDENEDEFLKRYTPDARSPLERINEDKEGNEDNEEYRHRREWELREIIKGPTPTEDWHMAQEELSELRNGRMSEEEEWEIGR